MTRNARRLFLSAPSAIAAMLAAEAAQAEMIDYGALQQLFGEPVTTSATGQPQRAAEAPAHMVIVTAEDIRRSGARDIPGVLKHVGGVDVLEWTNSQIDLGVRGYNSEFSSRLLVLIDGRQVYADHYGFTPWDTLPVELSAIRQIEVVKGPNTALFGFNAVGGVINIVTYNPDMDDIDAASATAGTQDLVQGSLVETFRVGERFALRLSAGGYRADDFETDIPPIVGVRRTKEDHDRAAFSADGVLHLTDDVHLRVDASHVEASRNEIAPTVILIGADYKTTSLQARLSADTPAGLIEATAYTNRITSVSDPTPALPSFDFDNRVSVFRLQDLVALGAAHNVRISVERRRNGVNTTPVGGGRVSYDVTSASGMWDWKIAPAVSVTNAVRLDYLELEREGTFPADYPFTNADWDRSYTETSFNSGLVWRASEEDTVRLIVSRGVQLPNLNNLGAALILTPVFSVTGNPTLEPSAITNLELDWIRDLDPLGARLRASVFHQETEDVMNLEGGVFPSPTGLYFGSVNIGDSRARGFELGLEGEIESWRWNLDYRNENVDDDYSPPFDARPALSTFEDTTPEHLFKAGLGWAGGRWELDGYVRHQSDVHGLLYPGAAMLVPIDAYAAIDGRLGFTLTDNVTFAVSGQNLGAPEQRQTSGPEVERRLLATLSVRR